ncbi:MAG: ATP-binding protein [Ignavibacterium sp.]|nr:ATP-binding protein [Ignavibacterium sp.]MDW8374685.1 response regulator [Ignavibacteriales bacterium]
MKISYLIILINFIVVLLVLPATAVLYYSSLSDSLVSLQKKNLSVSFNNFINTLQNYSQQLDASFYNFYKNKKPASELGVLHFVFAVENENISPLFLSDELSLLENKITIDEIKSSISNLYIKKAEIKDKTYLYGKIIDENFLNIISQKINADVVLFSDKTIISVSNQQKNQDLFFVFFDALNNLYDDKGYEVFSEESNSSNILAALYKPMDLDNSLNELSFLIFNKMEEFSLLKQSLKNILFFIGITGISISVLLSFLFTSRIRKKINQLSSATESIKEGNYSIKLELKGKDELTHLGDTFNLMVEKIRKNQKLLSDYSDFITLLNQKSTLKEIGKVALDKIISTCNFSIGALYLIESNDFVVLHSYGIPTKINFAKDKEILNQVVQSKKRLILNFDPQIPSLKTGLLEIKLNHLILQPIIYSDKVVAIIELISHFPISEEVFDYLEKIQEQLAIGLINAKAVSQLESYIAELKKLNEELKQSNIQIVEQNEMLTKLSEALQNQAKELSIQKEKAEESTKLKSQFLATISHELKTPLNSIIGLTELIINKSDISDHDKERLLVIQKSGKRLINMINSLLDFAQIESGRLKIDYSEFSINEFLNDISSEVEPLANNKNLKFFINKKFTDDFLLISDKEKLHQVLMNILGNAIKFTNVGQVELSISKINSEKILFAISDTGIGIEQTKSEIIFEEFRQADSSLSRKYDGTGLGLSISKKIIDMLGGKIWFESQLNVGTTFFIEIPINKNIIFSKSKLINENNINFKSDDIMILVVDDDPDSLFTMTEILNSYGYKNTVARGGHECLKILENLHPQLILLDIMMPEMDGFQTLKEIRNNRKYDQIKIFAVTAKAMENSIEVIKNSGFDDCIFKPINSKELISKISHHLINRLNYEYQKNSTN